MTDLDDDETTRPLLQNEHGVDDVEASFAPVTPPDPSPALGVAPGGWAPTAAQPDREESPSVVRMRNPSSSRRSQREFAGTEGKPTSSSPSKSKSRSNSRGSFSQTNAQQIKLKVPPPTGVNEPLLNRRGNSTSFDSNPICRTTIFSSEIETRTEPILTHRESVERLEEPKRDGPRKDSTEKQDSAEKRTSDEQDEEEIQVHIGNNQSAPSHRKTVDRIHGPGSYGSLDREMSFDFGHVFPRGTNVTGSVHSSEQDNLLLPHGVSRVRLSNNASNSSFQSSGAWHPRRNPQVAVSEGGRPAGWDTLSRARSLPSIQVKQMAAESDDENLSYMATWFKNQRRLKFGASIDKTANTFKHLQVYEQLDPEGEGGSVAASQHSGKTGTVKGDLLYRRSRHHTVRKPNDNIERLNFDLVDNEIYHYDNWHKKSHKYRGLYKWLLGILIAFLTAVTAFWITLLTDFLSGVNLGVARDGFKQSWTKGAFSFVGINLCYAFIAGALTVYVEPAAAGSGIPEVKAYLNGSWSRHVFNIRTLLVKLVGLVCAMSAHMLVGLCSPMVHAGTIIASGVSRGRSGTLNCDTGLGKMFRNDADARGFISCGASAGVAAAFGAPIGGMLFVLEEVSSFWVTHLTWRTFFVAAICTFILGILTSCGPGTEGGTERQCGDLTRDGYIIFPTAEEQGSTRYNVTELLIFCMLGVIGGILGGIFNYLNVLMFKFRKWLFRGRKPYLVMNVLLVSLITSFCVVLMPLLATCRDLPKNDDTLTNFPINLEDDGRFMCPEGQYNPIAAVLLSKKEHTIKLLFVRATPENQANEILEPETLWLSFLVYFPLTIITFGIDMPSGLFVPQILIGASMGRAIGLGFDNILGTQIDTGTFALMGAAAMLGGVTRMTISLTAIILEITNDIQFLLPLMIVIMTAKLVGDRINPPLYDWHVALKNIPYLESKLPSWLPTFVCAEDVMTKKVVVLPKVVKVSTLVKILSETRHNAFPVIQCYEKKQKYSMPYDFSRFDQGDGRFEGMVLRWHLCIILRRRHFFNYETALGNDFKKLDSDCFLDTKYKRVFKDQIARKLKLKPSRDYSKYVNLASYMQSACFVATPFTTLRRCHQLFRGCGLRHLAVVSRDRYVVGMITCENLLEHYLEEVAAELMEKMKDPAAFKTRIQFLQNEKNM